MTPSCGIQGAINLVFSIRLVQSFSARTHINCHSIFQETLISIYVVFLYNKYHLRVYIVVQSKYDIPGNSVILANNWILSVFNRFIVTQLHYFNQQHESHHPPSAISKGRPDSSCGWRNDTAPVPRCPRSATWCFDLYRWTDWWSVSGTYRGEILSSWWFQPIWKILVKMGIFPK